MDPPIDPRTAPRPDERPVAVYLRPWRVDITTRAGVPSLVARIALARAVGAALDVAGAPGPASVAVLLSGDDELAELNAHAMGHEGATDVLSFPLLPPDAFPPHPGRSPRAGIAVETRNDDATRFVLPPRHRTHLGDIAVSVERAVAQALEGRGGQTGDVRGSPADELRLLVTHGTLHLCGWDHADPEEETAMRALERQLLGADARA